MSVTADFVDALVAAESADLDELMALCLSILIDRSGERERRELDTAGDHLGFARARRQEAVR